MHPKPPRVMEEKKHGGKRPGAGRHPKKDKAENRTLVVTDELWKAAKIAAEQEGKKRNRWITDLIQKEIDKMTPAQE